jgi:hypothetical protein
VVRTPHRAGVHDQCSRGDRACWTAGLGALIRLGNSSDNEMTNLNRRPQISVTASRSSYCLFRPTLAAPPGRAGRYPLPARRPGRPAPGPDTGRGDAVRRRSHCRSRRPGPRRPSHHPTPAPDTHSRQRSPQPVRGSAPRTRYRARRLARHPPQLARCRHQPRRVPKPRRRPPIPAHGRRDHRQHRRRRGPHGPGHPSPRTSCATASAPTSSDPVSTSSPSPNSSATPRSTPPGSIHVSDDFMNTALANALNPAFDEAPTGKDR